MLIFGKEWYSMEVTIKKFCFWELSIHGLTNL